MKYSFLKKCAASAVVMGLFVSLISTPVAALAEVRTTTQQLESLSVSLISIGTLIENSPRISDLDRSFLMTQLVTISNQILQLRQGSYRPSMDEILNPAPVSDAGKESAQEAGLTQVKVLFYNSTNTGIVEIHYGSKVEKKGRAFPELASLPSFEQKMADLRTLLSTSISNEKNIKQADVRKLMQVTGRDPLRERSISQNSPTATYLADKFGQHSIVKRVEVRPGNGVGSIIISSDQDESIVLTLAHEVDYDGYFVNPRQYSYSYQFFIPTDVDTSLYSFDSDIAPTPVVLQTTSGVTEDEIESYVTSLFNDIPFTSRISDFEGKLVRFLTRNSAHYRSPSSNVLAHKVDCYAWSDKVVVNEFIEYLVTGLAAQYEDIDSITRFIAPLINDGDDYNWGCASEKRIF